MNAVELGVEGSAAFHSSKSCAEKQNKMTDITRSEPHILRGSHADREARAQHLANLFVGEMIPLLVQVRQDFLDKDREELIFNCRTFTQYCTQVLRYSEAHIRRLIAGHNPAKKFDGSGNRKLSEPVDSRTNVQRLHDSGFVERCMKYDAVLLGLVLLQAMCLDSSDYAVQLEAASLEGKIVNHIWEQAERRREAANGEGQAA